MSTSAKSLVDFLLEDGLAGIEITLRDGYQYVIPNGIVRRAKGDDVSCEHCEHYNSPAGLACEREHGHEGPHIAWISYSSGRLFNGGIWGEGYNGSSGSGEDYDNYDDPEPDNDDDYLEPEED